MLILGLETSSLGGSVALQDGDRPLAERELTGGQRSAQSLIPSIHELLTGASRKIVEIRVIGVCAGPGSFTGLRVGVTAAKTLAYALGATTIGLDTLDILAAQAPPGSGGQTLWAVVDAQRQEVFAASFRADAAGVWQRAADTKIVPVDAWLGDLKPGDLVSGPGLPRLAKRLPDGVTPLDRRWGEPRAATVARLAWQYYQQGRRDDFWTLTPAYFRPSAAEEKAKP